MYFEENDFNTLYKKLVKYVLKNGTNVFVRGKNTKECINCFITLQDIYYDYIKFSNTLAYERQNKYETYRKREIEWYESGCLVAAHAPADFWKKIADEDGKIQSNYGYLILHEKKPYTKEGLTSYRNVLDLLKKDLNSRQAIFHYNLPIHYANNCNDIPCTICTQILIRNNKLNFLVFQRSADLYRGLPYDVYWHCHLLKKLTDELKIENNQISYGTLSMILGSAHIYKENIEFMEKFIRKRA